MEALEHRHVAVHRRSRVRAVEEVGFVGDDDLAVDDVGRFDPALLEEQRVVLEVGGVCGYGQRGA